MGKFDSTRAPPWSRAVAVIVAIALVAAAARAPAAVRKPLWADEIGSARAYTQQGVRGVVSRVRSNESTPPGWYVAAWGVERAAGPRGSPKVPRTLSVLAGAATAALVVEYARRRMPLWAAALAGLLTALSYELVEHGAEARAYALLALLGVVFAMALEAATTRPSRTRLAALAAVTAAGAYTHYFFLFSAATGLGWAWARAAEARVRVSAAIAGGVLTLAPWLPSFEHQLRTQHHTYIESFSAAGVFNLYPNLFARAGAWQSAGAAGHVAVIAAVLAGAAILARRPGGLLGALLAVVPVVASCAMWAGGARVVDTRNLIVVAPFAGVAVAAAVAAIPLRPAAYAAGAAVVMAIAAAFWLETSEGRTSSDELAAALVAQGWTGADAAAVFAPYSEVLALSWSLPGHPVPALVVPAPGSCVSLYAIVETSAGRRWLTAHRAALLGRIAVPFFGFGPEGKRHPVDAQVVRLRWSYPLARSLGSTPASLVRMPPGRPRCARAR